MKRYLVAAALLGVVTLTIGIGAFIGDHFAARPRYFAVLPDDHFAPWGWGALPVLLLVPVVQHVSVLVAWRRQVVRDRRALAERIEAEAPKLADYRLPVTELRIGSAPARPDAAVNQPA